MGAELIPLLQMGIWIIVAIMLGLVALYVYLMKPKKAKEISTKEELIETTETEKKTDQNYGKFTGNLTRDSIFEFMEFDEIVDNMIVRKNGTQYIMILQCNGVNYDLMSEDEKISVEEGFVQFLNTLRFPIQLYIQSRTLNLRDIIDEYKSRVDNLTIEIVRDKIYDSIYDYSKKILRDKYSLFLYGNNPLTIIKNKDIKNNKKILVIKDSFGNSLVPFLTQNYEEIHVIDLRHFSSRLSSYLEENDFENILIIYNFINLATDNNVLRLKY